MLSGPRKKFCDGVVAGLSTTAAYRAAYPNSSVASARCNGARLIAIDSIRYEIARQRAKVEEIAGSSVMQCLEKRLFLARVVRARVASLEPDSDLWQSVETQPDGRRRFRLPDKLAAIETDNDLAGKGSEASVNDELAAMLRRCMS